MLAVDDDDEVEEEVEEEGEEMGSHVAKAALGLL